MPRTEHGCVLPAPLRLVPMALAGLVALASALAQPAEPLFADVSAEAGVAAAHRAVWDPEGEGRGYLAAGQAWGDYDNDGFVDLFVTGNLADNTLYRNRGDGTFAHSPLAAEVAMPGAITGGAVWADYDNDGWRDLYVVAYGRNALFRNEEGRGFRDVTESAGVGDTGKGTSATWADYDGDGLLDLYVVNWSCLPECDPEDVTLSRDRLYRNRGDGTFTDVSRQFDPARLQGAGFAATFFDYDNDGDPDLYVVNDRMTNPIGNVLWRNDGPGCGDWCWSDVSVESGADATLHSMGLAVGDLDNDADQEVFVTSMMTPMLLLDNGGGTFVDSTERAGVGVNPAGNASGWGTAFFDYDNDGWLDLYLAVTGLPPGPSGYLGGTVPDMEDFRRPHANLLFRNEGDGTFSELAESALGDDVRPSMGLAYADFDNDGFVDFVVGNWNEGYALFRNRGVAGTDNGWLTVRLVGGGAVNRDAIGARVYLELDDGRTLMQEVMGGSSLGAGNDTALHFGLGEAEVATMEVAWPNGLKQVFHDVPGDRILQLAYVNGGEDAEVATRWFALALDLVRDTPGFTPPVASRAFGYLGVTLYEAVVPGLPDRASLVGQLNGLDALPAPEEGASYHGPSVANRALAGIASRLVGDASPEAQDRIDALEAAMARRFSREADEQTRARSVAHGAAIAEAVYAWSREDGGDAGYADNFPIDYRSPAGPGLWVSTPPAYAGAMQPGWGSNRPFVAAPEDCRVAPPLAYSEDPASAFYAEALEVYETVTNADPEAQEIALFWADDPGATSTPPGHWVSILTRFLVEGGYGLERASEAYARLGLALSDSFVACWQAKYQYNVVRPITYIQRAIDASWNADGVTDPVATPPFPEYPSGHSVQSGAAAWVLTDLFGEVAFTDRTHDRRGYEPRRYDSFMAAAQEAAVSRLYGGIHFRAAIENGLEQGYCIGRRVASLRFAAP